MMEVVAEHQQGAFRFEGCRMPSIDCINELAAEECIVKIRWDRKAVWPVVEVPEPFCSWTMNRLGLCDDDAAVGNI